MLFSMVRLSLEPRVNFMSPLIESMKHAIDVLQKLTAAQ